MWSKYLSPYDLNPLNINPLKDLVERFVDFDGLRADSRHIYIAATNVQTGRLHIFPHDKISAEAVMASACLPAVFRAVEIDGVSYWDGGYLGNPVLYPFFRSTDTEDVLIVQINPLVRKKIPTSTREIVGRVNEITFNSSLMGDLRAIEFVNRLIDQGRLPHGTGENEYRRINVHRIVLEGLGERFSSATKAAQRLRVVPAFAQARPARGAALSRCALRRHRRALEHRSRGGGLFGEGVAVALRRRDRISRRIVSHGVCGRRRRGDDSGSIFSP